MSGACSVPVGGAESECAEAEETKDEVRDTKEDDAGAPVNVE